MQSGQRSNKQINAEWRFLARRVLDLCAEISSRGSRSVGEGSAEGRHQLAAFIERRETAMALLAAVSEEPAAGPARHMVQLRRLVSGLECSRSFFVPGVELGESA
jgi:hypothetical protein